MLKKLLSRWLVVWCALLASTAAHAQEFRSTEQLRSEYEQPSTDDSLTDSSGRRLKNEDTVVGEGMEVREVGAVKVIVPKGAEVYKEGSQVIFEDLAAYSARRFEGMSQEIDLLKSELARHDEEIVRLQKAIEELSKNIFLEGGKEE